jgi:TetR/AcrR family transcriptional regulator, transcriptional repressor for nem operon
MPGILSHLRFIHEKLSLLVISVNLVLVYERPIGLAPSMSKAQETKTRIIQQAAELFNQQGYAGSSISDIMRVTGLKKGGIYNHFSSKDELALEALNFAIQCIQQQYVGVLKGKRRAVDRLQAILSVYQNMLDAPPIKGGCPLLNTAVESDDAHPVLKERVQQAMDDWQHLICRIVEKGKSRGEIRDDIDAEMMATILISTIEGAVMMSKLYNDNIYMERALSYLKNYIEGQSA